VQETTDSVDGSLDSLTLHKENERIEEETEEADRQEILTEMSLTSRNVFKVHYVDHSKAYVPRMSANDKYHR